MKKFSLLAVALVSAVAVSNPALAEEGAHDNHIELFGGAAYSHGHTYGAGGLGYERRLPDSMFGLGVTLEFVATKPATNIVFLNLWVHPWGHSRFQIAPGYEKVEDHGAYVTRVGGAYDFMLTDAVVLSPTLNVDFASGHVVTVFGAALGFVF